MYSAINEYVFPIFRCDMVIIIKKILQKIGSRNIRRSRIIITFIAHHGVELHVHILSEPTGIIVISGFSVSERFQYGIRLEKFIFYHLDVMVSVRGHCDELQNPFGRFSFPRSGFTYVKFK